MSAENYWTRRNRQLSRRNVLRGAAVGVSGLGALSLVGCGSSDDDDDDSGGSGGNGGGRPRTDLTLEEFRSEYHGSKLKSLPSFAKQPKPGGTFTFAFNAPVSWDPTGPSAAALPSYNLFHNQLIRFRVGDGLENPNFQELEADLATSMPEQPDELTYTFKLHPDAKWHDAAPLNGRAVTSEDVKYTYEQFAKSPVQAPGFEDVESMETPDPQTLIIKTKQPAAYFVGNLVLPYHWIISPEQHAMGGDEMAKNPLGSGPYLLDAYDAKGGIEAKKNPNYWKKDKHGTQLPYLDRIVFRYFGSPVDAVASYRAKEIDHLVPSNFDVWKQVIDSDPDSVTQVTTPPPSAQPFISMNLTKKPFDDVRVRRALALAVDRDALIQTLAGGMAGYGYGMDQTYWGREWPFEASELGEWHHYDPEKAKELLAEAGYEDGIPETLELFTNVTAGLWFDVFVATANMWSQIGIKTDHQYSVDQSQWITRYFQKQYKDMMGVNFVGPAWDPDGFTYMALNSKSTKNYFHVNDPELDRLTLAQRQEMDTEKRKDIIRQIMDRDLDQVYRIWLIETYKINLRRPYVVNLADALAAWAPVGWGSHSMEQTWLDKA